MNKMFHLLAMVIMPLIFTGCAANKTEIKLSPDDKSIEPDTEVTITIVYDNNEYDNRLTTAWGFSCMVKLPEETILFDTGGDGIILLSNMAKLGIKPGEIDTMVLSHVHGDHTGGLNEFLEQNSQITVYMPLSFPQRMKQNVESYGANVMELHEPQELLEGVFTTGELDGGVREQSLLVRTSKGLVVITGCAHPGILNIVKRAKEITGGNIYLVTGGFHLAGASLSQINYIAESVRKLGVEKVAPCHCTGDKARKVFKDHFGENYIESGVGKEIVNLGRRPT